MKKLLIFLLASCLFAACNDTNPFAKRNKADKEEKNDRDKKGEDGYDDDKNTNYTGSNWSKKQRDEWRNKCLDEYNDEPAAKQMCDCMMDALQQKFSSEAEAKEADEDEIDDVIEKCETKFKNGNDYNGGYIQKTDRNDGLTDEGDNTGNWTDLQRQTFIKGCATAAQQQQGFTAQQANTYCDCMTRKVERKYSFEQAAKLTPADFQTQEWVNAAADCRSRIY